ncbi:MAG: BatA domain-containing protein [Planctomycetota bacterium]
MLTWFSNFANYLGNWMVSPWLFLGGIALLTVPILIHLLNKRKFKTVDWAAIEFLLEADKMNRRRIRLENLLLLLLRCMAILLIALLLARPFRPTTFAGGALQSVRFERVVVLDDSLSMLAVENNRSSFDVAKQTIQDLIASFQTSDSDESFSLVRLSQPDQPAIRGVKLNEETVGELAEQIAALQPSDVPVRLETALLEIEKLLRIEPEYVNRVVYIVSDLRKRDWDLTSGNQPSADASAAEVTPPSENGGDTGSGGVRATLERIANKSVGSFVVDVADNQQSGNIVLASIVPKDKVLIAGVQSPFEVTVANNSSTEVRDLQLSFAAGDSLPLTDRIDRIAANSTHTVPFSFTFAKPESASEDSAVVQPDPVPIRVTLATENPANRDQLQADNTQYFAARVERGIRTLLVDGDPSANYGQSEAFSLSRALAPPGELLSGVSLNTVTDAEFESVKLDDYHVVYLCNLYRLSDQRRVSLEKWVELGGSLVVFAGDQVDEHIYNETLYRDGQGLLPGRLVSVRGDETEATWVNFLVSVTGHPALNVFAGENNPFASWVKVFRWWHVEPDEEQIANGDVLVSARFNDQDDSPAVLEKQFGQGRVVFVATPADRDWSNWPLDPSFLIFSQELTRYVVKNANRNGTISVGQSIRHPLDLTRYKIDVSLRYPNDTTTTLNARPVDSETPQSVDETSWVVEYNKVDQSGFYEMTLVNANGSNERALFAANVDVSEGDLSRVDMTELRSNLNDLPIEIVRAEDLVGTSAMGVEGELWPLILSLAVGCLCSEQILGWFFGRNR